MNLQSTLQRLVRAISTTGAPAATESGIANALMESSQARGLNPHQAEELRLAARAYLSVVR
ncbi:MAG TPA: hypothetical protein VLJ57_14205 [Burkholderiaceae bacterium]|nr:hypothetical protein [Burkholderiaceae bacterium]